MCIIYLEHVAMGQTSLEKVLCLIQSFKNHLGFVSWHFLKRKSKGIFLVLPLVPSRSFLFFFMEFVNASWTYSCEYFRYPTILTWREPLESGLAPTTPDERTSVQAKSVNTCQYLYVCEAVWVYAVTSFYFKCICCYMAYVFCIYTTKYLWSRYCVSAQHPESEQTHTPTRSPDVLLCSCVRFEMVKVALYRDTPSSACWSTKYKHTDEKLAWLLLMWMKYQWGKASGQFTEVQVWYQASKA